MTENEIAKQILDAAFVVHTKLGPGLLESVYHVCLGFEMRNAGLTVVENMSVPVSYKDLRFVCALKADFLVNDTVILGRAATSLADSDKRAPETLLGTLVHELTHARNLAQSDELGRTAHTDTDVFVDTSLAQTRTALTGIPTAAGMRSFVEEVVARHLHWIVLHELAGTPGSIAVLALGSGNLAAAAHFYFFDRRRTWDANDYGRELFTQGDAAKFAQLATFLRRCAAQSLQHRLRRGQRFDAGISVRCAVL